MRNSNNAHRSGLPLAWLLWLLALAAALPMLGLIWFALDRIADERAETDVRTVAELAQTLSLAVERELEAVERTARALAAQIADDGSRADHERPLVAAARATGLHFVLTDGDLRQVVNTGGQGPASVRHPDEVRVVLASGEPMVTDLRLARFSGAFMFGVRVPVHVDGRIRFVLTALPEAASIGRIIADSHRQPRFFATVLDGSGRIVARSYAGERFVGRMSSERLRDQIGLARSGVLNTTDLEGRPAITAFETVPRTTWRVVAWVPREQLEQARAGSTRLIGLAALVAVVVSTVFGLALARMIRASAAEVARGALKMGRGEQPAIGATWVREANGVAVALERSARQLRDRERRMHILMREVSHRSKNLLTVIMSMARQSARTSQTLPQFVRAFEARLHALARTQDMLVATDWAGGRLDGLVRHQLEPFFGPETTLEATGPDVTLNALALQNIGLSLHELATNALKYGALSAPGGRVSIAWSWRREDDGARWLELVWEERDGPPASPPQRSGFGRRIVEKVTPVVLHGRVEMDWRPEGLRWTLHAPASAIEEQT